MEEKEKQEEDLEEQLKKIDAYMLQMEKESQEFFEALRTSPHQIDELLSDPKQHSKETFEYLQDQRYQIEAALEQRIAEVNASVVREPRDTPPVKGHWIFVR
ncbi:MAG: hypothetical protein JSR46_04215 [Verrucomicrobia bacterium]|nr:hypothetical protein [Verrucomicrobiota bacterium]